MRYIKSKGIVFWITGLPGSGKTEIAKKIKKSIVKKYGKTILISGDDLRKILKFKSYKKNDRLNYAKVYSKLVKKLSEQNINVIIATVALFRKVHKWNRKNITNYVEIYIKSDIKKIIKLKKKYFYIKKVKNILGQDIKPEFPKSPNIIIENMFEKSIASLSTDLISKINKIV